MTAHTESVGGKNVEMKAEVALLSRNIKVEGVEYEDMEQESFGCRVLIGQGYRNGDSHSGWCYFIP